MCINVLLFQHWIIILLGIPIIPFTYIDLVRADKDLIEKFGDYCKAYTKEIPRANARAHAFFILVFSSFIYKIQEIPYQIFNFI